MFFGSGASLGIGINIQLNNQFSNNANQIVNSMNRLNINSRQLLRDNLSTARNVGIGMASVGYMTVRALNKVNDKFATYEYTLKSVQAVAGDMSNNELKQLDKTVMSLGTKFGRLPTEVANAALQLTKAGVEAKNLRDMLTATLLLSTSADVPLTGERGGAEMLVNIMTQFNKQGSQAASVVDMIAMSANKSTIDVKDFFEAVKYSGQVFQQLKVPFEDYATMVAVIGNAGLKGSIAGTTLANMGRYMVKSITELRAGEGPLHALGMRVDNLVNKSGDLERFDVIFRRLQERIKHLSSVEKLSILEDIFGVRGARATTIMAHLEQYDKIRTSILESSKKQYALNVAMQKLDSAKGLSDILAASREALDIKLGEAFKPIVMVLLPLLISGLEKLVWIVSTPLGKALVIGIAGFGLLIGLVGLILIPLATLGILLTSARVGWAAMRVTALWSMNAIIGSLKKGIFWMKAFGMAQTGGGNMRWPAGTKMGGKNVGGQFFNPASIFGSMFGKFKIGRLLGKLGGFGRMLGVAVRGLAAFGRFIPVIGWVILAFQLLLDPIGTITTIFRALASAVMILFQVIRAILWPLTGLLGIDPEGYKLGGNIGDSMQRIWDPEGYRSDKKWETENPGYHAKNREPFKDGTQLANHSGLPPHLNINVHVGGEKVLQKSINTRQENEINSLLGVKMGN